MSAARAAELDALGLDWHLLRPDARQANSSVLELERTRASVPALPHRPHERSRDAGKTRDREEWTQLLDSSCYCGKLRQVACTQCAVCKNWFHHDCVKVNHAVAPAAAAAVRCAR